MKSVGETMAIGRTFPEAFQKALASLEIGSSGLESRLGPEVGAWAGRETIRARLSVPNWERVWYMGDAIRTGFSTEEIHELSAVDPWFIEQIRRIVDAETGGPRGPRRVRSPPDAASQKAGIHGQTAGGPLGRIAFRGGRPKAAGIVGDRSRLQDDRHLRRRVRSAHAVSLLDV